jgi:hypothetical protein
VREEPGGLGGADATHARLARLERRVDELERSAERQQRARSRTRLLFLVGVALYLLVVYWELTKLV